MNLKQILLDCFKPLAANYVRKLISKVANKQCEDDPIPTKLLKELIQMSDDILSILTNIINKSLNDGIFPDPVKML